MAKESFKLTFVVLVTFLLATISFATAQQPKKVARIGYLTSRAQLVSPPVPRPFGWLCASLAT